jgi:phytoene desaturase
MSLYVLYFGLNRKWPETQLDHHSILLSEDPDRTLRHVFDGKENDPSSNPGRFLYVHMPTLTDSSVAPAGCDSLYVLVSAPAIYPKGRVPEDFAQVRSDVITELERFLPGFESSIAAEHHIDPQYFRDELGSPYGAAFGPLPTLLQSAWFRPHNRSPRMKGLYLVGAGTHPGAGVPAVLASAKITTGLISQDFRK